MQAVLVISKLWPITVALVSLIGWFVRLEMKQNFFKQSQDNSLRTIENRLHNIEKSLRKLEINICRLQGAADKKEFDQCDY